MDASFSEDQDLIRSTATAFFRDWAESGALRKLTDQQVCHDTAAWAALAGELGFAGLTVPESAGGAGLGSVERAILMEEMGKVLFMSPYLGTCVLATDVLASVGGKPCEDLLGQIAEGRLTAAFVHLGGTEDKDLSGTAELVVDAAQADKLIVAAGGRLLLVDPTQDGVSCQPAQTLDLTRGRGDVVLNRPVYELLAEGSGVAAALEKARALSAISLAAEQVGGAEALLTQTVAYVMDRKQFGRPVGSFQAVKHRCADMMIRVEAARSAVYLAAAVADTDETALIEHAAIAKSEASEAYFQIAGDAIQMHGGVGVTWEYDLHFHFKRARAGKDLLGTPEQWRSVLASHIGLNEVAA